MATNTLGFNQLVPPGKRIKIIMVETGGCPGHLGMANNTVRRILIHLVIRIDGCIKIILMASDTCVRRCSIISIMAGIAIIRYACVCTNKRIKSTMVKC